MNIVEVIPYGHDNAVTRAELVMLTGLNDRRVRDEINQCKELIINLQDGHGYFRPLPEEAHLVETWMLLFQARIRDEQKRVTKAKHWRRIHVNDNVAAGH